MAASTAEKKVEQREHQTAAWKVAMMAATMVGSWDIQTAGSTAASSAARSAEMTAARTAQS